ncbi:MAG: OsmC family protein [Cryomorphaceae bacterium]|nr:OsmC family protein [Cryomorphaceae bacterium]
MTAKIQYTGNLRTISTHLSSGQTIISDAPVDNQGRGEAFSPTDLAATSLASCMITVMGIYAENSGIDLKGLTAEVTKTMASDPRRISKIEITIIFPEGLEDKYRLPLERVAKNCPVAKSLHPEIEQIIHFKY